MTYSVYVSDQKFENRMDLLLIIDKNKSHYMYIKDFDRFMCITKKKKTDKKYFCKCCLQCFSSDEENCVVINGKQSLKLKGGPISFKKIFKQLHVPFKIYSDFECLLKGVKSSDANNGS